MPLTRVAAALQLAKKTQKAGRSSDAAAIYRDILAAFPKNQHAKQAHAMLQNVRQPATGSANPPQDKIRSLIALYNQRRLGEASHQARQLLADYPNSVLLWTISGAVSKASSDLASAVDAHKRVTELSPHTSDGFNNLGVLLQEQGKLQDAIAAFQRALSLTPDNAGVYVNLGNALLDQGQPAEAIAAYARAVSLKPDYAGAYSNIGNALQLQGKSAQAISAYETALSLNPEDAETHNNMGNVLRSQGKFADATAAYQKALSLRPDYAEAYYNIGTALSDLGRFDDALAAYRKALTLRPNDAGAHNAMGSALQRQGRLDEAISAYAQALSLMPRYAGAANNMGVALQELGKPEQAIAAYERALSIKPDYADAHSNLGITLQDQGKIMDAIAAYRKALALTPENPGIEAQLYYQLRQTCDWTGMSQTNAALGRLGASGKSIPPFLALPLEDDPQRQLIRSQNYASAKFRNPSATKFVAPDKFPSKLRIAYFSSDFHYSPGMYLMAGLLQQHNRTEFEIYAYSYGPPRNDEMRNKVVSGVDTFFDIRTMSNTDVAQHVKEHKIDIAINRDGYTKNSRTELFAARLAPVQIHYLGYPSTLGSDLFDYIVADPIVVPGQARKFYSENIIYLPHSYQPNDDTRVIADAHTTRHDFDLPESAFVFCCFNNSYKISPTEFDIWMRLLHKVEDSVLWLLRTNKWAVDNLRKEAVARKIDPSRLIFAEKIPHAHHLARHRHADLFIDTFNVNAHTTASDALWAGLPVVTKLGQQFAARVSASLLSAIGLEDLIAYSAPEYEALILELASNPEKLRAIRDRLSRNRTIQPLFNTKLYTQHFETGLKQAYSRFYDGKGPADIYVK